MNQNDIMKMARPILFSGPMVRALLDGTKTQTRRVVKLTAGGHVKEPGGNRRWHPDDFTAVRACPYGQPGDQLWVRESFADLTEDLGKRWEKFNPETKLYERGKKPFIWYRADGEQPDPGSGTPLNNPWKPSIHMPRWASRITLEITGVRVERLQDISEDDALAEGCTSTAIVHEDGEDYTGHYASEEYQDLWEAINGPGSWDANPWVWVIEFKRVGVGSA